ncbi:MAG: DUF3943 domain-containing protein [Saprospiraceae bacterium]|nr:DUF3943 domain-containing protein [Saprospiraceae bacterium]
MLNNIEHISSQFTDTFPLKEEKVLKKNYYRPVSYITGLNVLINRYDVHIKKAEWAVVTPSSWWVNIKRGFMTDGDAFPTNWFGHPYHGSLFYNSSRLSGFGYLESIPYVIGGSLMWEYFGETEPPSEIDLFTTSLGGAYLGEVLYRLSDLSWNHRSAGRNTALRNIAGGVLNPMAGLNRLLFGYGIPYSESSETSLQGDIFVGFNYPFRKTFTDFRNTGSILEMNLTYGNLLDRYQNSFGPFEYFTVDSWFNFPHTANFYDSYFNFSSDAVIIGRKLVNQRQRTEIVSISQHYDFVHNDLFKIGSVVVTGDWWRFRTIGKFRYMTSFKAGVVLFGSGNSEMVKPVNPEIFENFYRDYIYGQGFMIETEAMFAYAGLGKVVADVNFFRIFSRIQPKGWENLQLLRARYLYPFYSGLSLGLGYDYYHRNSFYYTSRNYERLNTSHNELRLLIGYAF